jgi:hypothetical protein
LNEDKKVFITTLGPTFTTAITGLVKRIRPARFCLQVVLVESNPKVSKI